MFNLSNRENPDKMPHNAAFDQGLHYLQGHQRSSKKEVHFYPVIITSDSSIDIMDHPKFIVTDPKERGICAWKVNSIYRVG